MGRRSVSRRRATENKPIFLSIGYSTCHWCHVMAHESFENDDVASVLNASFVPIKVDREERPDVDRVYMTFVQATTGSGGWPMSVWLTPDLKPFYGGTYFPPSSRWGRPGFVDILGEIARVWGAEPTKVQQSAESLTTQLQGVERCDAGRRTCRRRLRSTVSRRNSGTVRSGARRIRRRAEVSASVRAAVSPPRVRTEPGNDDATTAWRS